MHTAFQIVAIALILAILFALPADAACHCVIVPDGGPCDCEQTPPVTGIACAPETGDIVGCDDKAWLAFVSVARGE